MISTNDLSSASYKLSSRLNGADTNVGWGACQEVSARMFGNPKILWGKELRKLERRLAAPSAICLRRFRLRRLARHLFRTVRIAGRGDGDGHGIGTPEAEPLARLIIGSPHPREILGIDQADLGECFEDGALLLVDG